MVQFESFYKMFISVRECVQQEKAQHPAIGRKSATTPPMCLVKNMTNLK